MADMGRGFGVAATTRHRSGQAHQ